jgi:hypothetical protein
MVEATFAFHPTAYDAIRTARAFGKWLKENRKSPANRRKGKIFLFNPGDFFTVIPKVSHPCPRLFPAPTQHGKSPRIGLEKFPTLPGAATMEEIFAFNLRAP